MAQTATHLLVEAATISEWERSLRREGTEAFNGLPKPVNQFPEYVTYVVQRLKALCPRLGNKKIAQVLARAGLHVGVSTVRRLLERTTPPQGEATAVDAGQSQNVDEAPKESTDECAAEAEPKPRPEAKSQAVRADRPNQIWEIDFTLVPTAGGFWMSWIPNALLQRWPFCWWVALVIDVHSRRVMGLSVFSDQPSATAVCSFLEDTITSSGAKPKYLVQDKGGQPRTRHAESDLRVSPRKSAGHLLRRLLKCSCL